ncbi:MAG: hypothetical protein BM562_05360 [Alphaproteobacteria bacterium MedPE-SWcel]|nr:MAG: hypothetical protein BM562_05360 [Alphaproteobacteria bacterium MedPE-SWcel]
MPRTQEIVTLNTETWTEMTSGDALAGIKFEALDGPMEVRRGDATVPDPALIGWRYGTGKGDRLASLDELSRASGNRLYGRSLIGNAINALVDHA